MLFPDERDSISLKDPGMNKLENLYKVRINKLRELAGKRFDL